ncbi:MAG: DUF1405 domain-containing protein [Candidatus Diapherotrites archaeon]
MEAKPILWFTIIANLAGAYFGFFVYYSTQLLSTNPLLWVFVADSPLSVTVFAIALVLIAFNKKSDFLNFLASALVLKYGLWTIFVITAFPDIFFSPQSLWLYIAMLVLHAGMVLEAFALAGKTTLKTATWVIVLAWLLLNDVLDYGFGYFPSSIAHTGLSIVAPVSLLLSFACILLLFAAFRKNKPNALSKLLFFPEKLT